MVPEPTSLSDAFNHLINNQHLQDFGKRLGCKHSVRLARIAAAKVINKIIVKRSCPDRPRLEHYSIWTWIQLFGRLNLIFPTRKVTASGRLRSPPSNQRTLCFLRMSKRYLTSIVLTQSKTSNRPGFVNGLDLSTTNILATTARNNGHPGVSTQDQERQVSPSTR